MKSKGIVKKGTKPPSLTVCMIIYEGKSKESVISMLEYWDNNIPGYRIKDSCISKHQKMYFYNIHKKHTTKK